MVSLENFTSAQEFLLSDDRIIRSIVFVRNGLVGNALPKQYRGHENGDNRHIFEVTDLLDNNQYLVEPIESGYRLYFQINGFKVTVEVASGADLPDIAQDLGRRLAESDAQTR
jgi:hypothetical protein